MWRELLTAWLALLCAGAAAADSQLPGTLPACPLLRSLSECDPSLSIAECFQQIGLSQHNPALPFLCTESTPSAPASAPPTPESSLPLFSQQQQQQQQQQQPDSARRSPVPALSLWRSASLMLILGAAVIGYLGYWYLDDAPPVLTRRVALFFGARTFHGNAPLSKVLQYQVDFWLSSDPSSKVVMLAIWTVVLIVFGWLALYAAGENSLYGAFWSAVATSGLDWTSVESDILPVRCVSLAVSIGGLVVTALLVSLVSASIADKVEDLKKGKTMVLEYDHVVIIGWSIKIFTLLKELCMGMARFGGVPIVIFSEKAKEEMEDLISQYGINLRGSTIICRTGDPLVGSELSKVSVEFARSVIVLSTRPDPEESDARLLRIVLNMLQIHKFLRLNGTPGGLRGNIVCEVCRQDHADLVMQMASFHQGAAAKIHLLISRDFVGRLIVVCARYPSVAEVLAELIGCHGSEFYVDDGPNMEKIEGRQFHTLHRLYPQAVPVGIKRAGGVMWLNPPPNCVVKAGDAAIVLAHSYKQLKLFMPTNELANFTQLKRTSLNARSIVNSLKGSVNSLTPQSLLSPKSGSSVGVTPLDGEDKEDNWLGIFDSLRGSVGRLGSRSTHANGIPAGASDASGSFGLTSKRSRSDSGEEGFGRWRHSTSRETSPRVVPDAQNALNARGARAARSESDGGEPLQPCLSPLGLTTKGMADGSVAGVSNRPSQPSGKSQEQATPEAKSQESMSHEAKPPPKSLIQQAMDSIRTWLYDYPYQKQKAVEKWFHQLMHHYSGVLYRWVESLLIKILPKLKSEEGDRDTNSEDMLFPFKTKAVARGGSYAHEMHWWDRVLAAEAWAAAYAEEGEEEDSGDRLPPPRSKRFHSARSTRSSSALRPADAGVPNNVPSPTERPPLRAAFSLPTHDTPDRGSAGRLPPLPSDNSEGPVDEPPLPAFGSHKLLVRDSKGVKKEGAASLSRASQDTSGRRAADTVELATCPLYVPSEQKPSATASVCFTSSLTEFQNQAHPLESSKFHTKSGLQEAASYDAPELEEEEEEDSATNPSPNSAPSLPTFRRSNTTRINRGQSSSVSPAFGRSSTMASAQSPFHEGALGRTMSVRVGSVERGHDSVDGPKYVLPEIIRPSYLPFKTMRKHSKALTASLTAFGGSFLLCGWRRDIVGVIKVLDEYVTFASEVWMYSDLPLDQRKLLLKQGGLTISPCGRSFALHHIRLVFDDPILFGSTLDSGQLEELKPLQFRAILILANDSVTDPLLATQNGRIDEGASSEDSRSLSTNFLIRSIQMNQLPEQEMQSADSAAVPGSLHSFDTASRVQRINSSTRATLRAYKDHPIAEHGGAGDTPFNSFTEIPNGSLNSLNTTRRFEFHSSSRLSDAPILESPPSSNKHLPTVFESPREPWDSPSSPSPLPRPADGRTDKGEGEQRREEEAGSTRTAFLAAVSFRKAAPAVPTSRSGVVVSASADEARRLPGVPIPVMRCPSHPISFSSSTLSPTASPSSPSSSRSLRSGSESADKSQNFLAMWKERVLHPTQTSFSRADSTDTAHSNDVHNKESMSPSINLHPSRVGTSDTIQPDGPNSERGPLPNAPNSERGPLPNAPNSEGGPLPNPFRATASEEGTSAPKTDRRATTLQGAVDASIKAVDEEARDTEGASAPKTDKEGCRRATVLQGAAGASIHAVDDGKRDMEAKQAVAAGESSSALHTEGTALGADAGSTVVKQSRHTSSDAGGAGADAGADGGANAKTDLVTDDDDGADAGANEKADLVTDVGADSGAGVHTNPGSDFDSDVIDADPAPESDISFSGPPISAASITVTNVAQLPQPFSDTEKAPEDDLHAADDSSVGGSSCAESDARALGKSVSMNPSLSLNGDPPGDQEDFPDYMDMLLMYDCAHHKKSAAEWMSDIKRVGDRSVIVTEIIDPKTRHLIKGMARNANRYVMSTETISQMLALVSCVPDRRIIFKELFSPIGNELLVRPPQTLFESPDEVTSFFELSARTSTLNEVLIGYIQFGTGHAILNPEDKEEAILGHHNVEAFVTITNSSNFSNHD